MKKIVIINRYYPPNPAISGNSACEMVREIAHRKKHFKMMVRHIHAPYAGGYISHAPAGITGGMSSIYNGKNKILRFVGNFIEGYRLVRLSLPYADAIITLTDPPMLNFWAGLLCHHTKTPWIYWALDLYPDAFVAAGIVNNTNLIYQYFQKSIKSYPPDLLISLGSQQNAFLKTKFQKDIFSTILPCGIIETSNSKLLPEWHSKNKTVFAYVGNMGEAHDPEFLIQLIQRMNPNKHICLLSIYGSKSGQVLSKIENHPSVRMIDYIPQEFLSYIDINLVTLLPDWTHICVPSKAVSAICSGTAIAFQGSKHSDIWKMFNKAAFYVATSHQPFKMIEDLNRLLSLTKCSQTIQNKHTQALLYRKQLLNMKLSAYDTIASFLQAF